MSDEATKALEELGIAPQLTDGQALRLDRMRALFGPTINPESGEGWADYVAPDGKRFVLLLMGAEPLDGSAQLDPDAVLRSWGWTYEPHIPEEESVQ